MHRAVMNMSAMSIDTSSNPFTCDLTSFLRVFLHYSGGPQHKSSDGRTQRTRLMQRTTSAQLGKLCVVLSGSKPKLGGVPGLDLGIT